MKNKIFNLNILFLALLNSGCSALLKTEYTPPKITYPTHWQQSEEHKYTTIFNWNEFADPELEYWLQQVMRKNSDVALAILQVNRARLEAKLVGINTSPSISLSASTNISKSKSLSDSSSWERIDTTKSSLSLNYEVDLWGKLSIQQDVAQWSLQASVEELKAAKLILLRQATENYWNIALINQQIATGKKSLEYAQETLRLTQSRYLAGSISGLDITSAKQMVLSQEGELIVLQHTLQQSLNEQTILLGSPPDNFIIKPQHLSNTSLPDIQANIPTSVLRRRPDIHAAELRLQATLADVDIKKISYYPTFTLTSSLGGSSNQLLEFLRNPMAIIDATLALPFTDWRKMQIDIDISRNEYDKQVLQFRQSLYKAMVEIDNALSLRQQLIQQESHLNQLLVLAKGI